MVDDALDFAVDLFLFFFLGSDGLFNHLVVVLPVSFLFYFSLQLLLFVL